MSKKLPISIFVAFSTIMSAQDTHHRVIENQFSTAVVPAAAGAPLAVKFAALPSGAHWVLGVRVEEGSSAALTVGVSPSPISGIALGTPFRPLAADRVAIAPGIIEISPELGARGAVIAYLTVPAPIPLTVSVGDAVIVDHLSIPKSLAIKDGQLHPGDVEGMGQLMAILASAGNGSVAAAPKTAVQAEALKSHLLNYVDLGASGTRTGLPGLYATAILTISDAGTVVSVSTNPKPSQPSPEVIAAMKQWTFTPFAVDGRPAEVTAVVPITDDGEGHLFTFVSPAATLQ